MAEYAKRILIVDDNKSIHTDIKQILCPSIKRDPKFEHLSHELFNKSLSSQTSIPTPYNIDDAYTGERAIELVRKSLFDEYPYSLIFMDIRMPPGIDGIQAIHKIWRQDPYTEIIICSSYTDYSWEEIISNFPSTDQLFIIRKPFDSIEIQQATLSLTKKWDLKRKNREYICTLREEVRKRTDDLNKKNNQLLLEIENHKNEEKKRIKLENELHQTQKMDAFGQLAGGIAHDYNNMLGAISGYAEMIKEKFSGNNAKLNKYIDIIISASRHSANLTSKLLTFARKGNIKIDPVDMHDIILEVGQILEYSIDKRIKIKIQLNANKKVIMGDYSQMQNVLLNLALNARDAMPDGGDLIFTTENTEIDKKRFVSSTFKAKSGSFIQVSISDTGEGMDEETKTRIFEPFFTTKKKGSGTGLGLTSVYGTLQSHNGLIEVFSELGKGTVFKISLPLIDKYNISVSNISESIQKGSGKILFIEDEKCVAEMVMDMLKNLGYSVTVCKDGREAVDFYNLHYQNIELVILDLIMPEIGGYQCFFELKKINPEVKVIITSGFYKNNEAERMIQEGALGFLKKPFTKSELSTIVKKVVNCK